MRGYPSGERVEASEAWGRLLHPDDDVMMASYLADLLPS
jgi:hypothetical protein